MANNFSWITYRGLLGTWFHNRQLYDAAVHIVYRGMKDKVPSWYLWPSFHSVAFTLEQNWINWTILHCDPRTYLMDEMCKCTYHHLQCLLSRDSWVICGHLSERLLQRLYQQHYGAQHGEDTKHQTAIKPGTGHGNKTKWARQTTMTHIIRTLN